MIGPHTVNTVPPATLNFYRDHGTVAPTLEANLDDAKAQLTKLTELGIDLDEVTQKLLADGVASFAKSFHGLMQSVAEKRAKLRAEWQTLEAALASYQRPVDNALQQIRDAELMKRIWQHDHTVWRPDPTEITNRLGWLHAPENMSEGLDRLTTFVEEVQQDGYSHAVLLGMGGSSLAPEGFYKMFGRPAGQSNRHLELIVIDSTDPDMIRERTAILDLTQTLFIVATKSGGTVETLSAFKYFYNRVAEAVGRDEAGAHFVAITDPGSGLAALAVRHGFRETFLNDPNIGGRYSALSYFGLVPAALVGVDLERLLERALTAACNAESANCPVAGDNVAGHLGVIIGELAKEGRDKLTIVTPPELASFGNWVEQLIAESTGKDGKGIVPVVGEPLGPPEVYRDDRVFVELRLKDRGAKGDLGALAKAGHPVITLRLNDLYDVGSQFFLWEMATAVAGARLGIHPFDQPNVEAAKVLARTMMAEYVETSKLPAGTTAPLEAESLQRFLEQAQPGNYIALQAYVQPTEATDAALTALRVRLRDRYKLATTLGYGPRFLHSTGQLHKGDGGTGLFIQLTSHPAHDLPIPDEAGSTGSTVTFGVLKMAQALGDAQALTHFDRRVIRFQLGTDVIGGLDQLQRAVSEDAEPVGAPAGHSGRGPRTRRQRRAHRDDR